MARVRCATAGPAGRGEIAGKSPSPGGQLFTKLSFDSRICNGTIGETQKKHRWVVADEERDRRYDSTQSAILVEDP